MTEPEKFDGWAIVEVMGHKVYAGRAVEVTIAGAAFLRIDVPAKEGREAFTKIVGAGSIYCITPCTEEVAMRAATARVSNPFYELSIPAGPALPAPVSSMATRAEDDYDDYDDECLEAELP